MKKGQGQLIAFVLLIGFTVVLGIMVGNWMIKQSGKMGKATERAEVDVRCADVSIVSVCDPYLGLMIKNTGNFKVKLKSGNQYVGGNDWIYPGSESSSISLNNQTIIPFIEIEGKEHGCTNKVITVEEGICA